VPLSRFSNRKKKLNLSPTLDSFKKCEANRSLAVALRWRDEDLFAVVDLSDPKVEFGVKRLVQVKTAGSA
jgi:hypothetical protein